MLFHFKVQTNTQECAHKHRRCVITTNAVKFEAAQTHFLRDAFVAVAVVVD